MFRSMLAFALVCVISEVAWGQYPFGLHSSRTNEGPLTNLGRYHGFGYGPGYHDSQSRPSAMRWFQRESLSKSNVELARESRAVIANRPDQSPLTVHNRRRNPLR